MRTRSAWPPKSCEICDNKSTCSVFVFLRQDGKNWKAQNTSIHVVLYTLDINYPLDNEWKSHYAANRSWQINLTTLSTNWEQITLPVAAYLHLFLHSVCFWYHPERLLNPNHHGLEYEFSFLYLIQAFFFHRWSNSRRTSQHTIPFMSSLMSTQEMQYLQT